MNNTHEMYLSKEELNSLTDSLGKQTEEIDFEHIKIEKEYFFSYDEDVKDKSAQTFIGDAEESTEIDSLLNPLTSSFRNLKLSQISEENTETEEILAILRKKSSTAVIPAPNYSRALSKSNPQFYEAKRIPLKGRVIEYANLDTKENTEEVGSPLTVSNISLPVHSSIIPVRPKCIPRRSFNDDRKIRLFSNSEFCNDTLMSKIEKKLDL